MAEQFRRDSAVEISFLVSSGAVELLANRVAELLRQERIGAQAQVISFPTDHEPWRDWRAVADYFSVSRSTVNRWVQQGCPSRLTAGARRFRLSEVERWAQGLPDPDSAA